MSSSSIGAIAASNMASLSATNVQKPQDNDKGFDFATLLKMLDKEEDKPKSIIQSTIDSLLEAAKTVEPTQEATPITGINITA